MENIGSKQFLSEVIRIIAQCDKLHAETLTRNVVGRNGLFNYLREMVHRFFEITWMTPSQVAEDYLHLVRVLRREAVYFEIHGKYSCPDELTAFQQVYSQPQVMKRYLNGLLMSHLLWSHHYATFEFFTRSLPLLFNTQDHVRVLDMGAGHGLFSTIVRDVLINYQKIDVVDVSAEALNTLSAVMGEDRVQYHNCFLNGYDTTYRYDLIIMGEVLEHLNNPLSTLAHVTRLLRQDGGLLWLTVPTNAPAPDHVYLFRSAHEVFDMINAAGLQVVESVENEAVESKTKIIGAFCAL